MMSKFKTSSLPEPDKWIRLYCHDWSPYRVIGKRIPYKKTKNGAWRFMGRDKDGSMNNMQDSWRECEYWEYCKEEDKP